MSDQDDIKDQTDDVDTDRVGDKSDGADSLGDAGKKALDAMKADLKRAREELAELRAANGDKRGVEAVTAKARREAQHEVEELRAKLEGREKEYAEQKRQREAEAAALTKANERILKAEIRAAAAAKFADPADALQFIDLSSFEVGDDGEVNRSAIDSALSNLIEKKPYLAAQGGKRFQGSADGGARNGNKPSQLTRADLKRMSPREIVKAKAEGRLDDALSGK